MTLAEWPAADREAWLQALEPRDILDDPSPAAAWAPATQHKVQVGYGRYLGWLAQAGLLDSAASVAALMQPELVLAYLRELMELNAPMTVATRADDLHQFCQAVLPERDLDWLARLKFRLRQDAVPVRDKRRRLRPVAELVALGERLMRQAEGSELPNRERLITYRDGLMLGLLALRPLRLKNFAQLTVGGSLRRLGPGWRIVFGAGETKNKRPLELPFPDRLVPALEHYLRQIRPLLLACRGHWYRDPGTALWISSHGSALIEAAIRGQIRQRTAAAFGQPLCPHLFRDCAATNLALVSPEAVRASGLVLGHADYRTTEKHYNLARAVDAAASYHAVLGGLRRKKRR